MACEPGSGLPVWSTRPMPWRRSDVSDPKARQHPADEKREEHDHGLAEHTGEDRQHDRAVDVGDVELATCVQVPLLSISGDVFTPAAPCKRRGRGRWDSR